MNSLYIYYPETNKKFLKKSQVNNQDESNADRKWKVWTLCVPWTSESHFLKSMPPPAISRWGWHDPETPPDSSTSVLYPADALKKLQRLCLAIYHSSQPQRCPSAEGVNWEALIWPLLTIGQSLSVWPWPRPWESLISKEPHPDYDKPYHVK